jgi:hypothetical protein
VSAQDSWGAVPEAAPGAPSNAEHIACVQAAAPDAAIIPVANGRIAAALAPDSEAAGAADGVAAAAAVPAPSGALEALPRAVAAASQGA